MKLKELELFIGALLTNFNTKGLPNLPNIAGIFNQSDISYAIVKGEATASGNFCEVTFQISASKSDRIDTGDNTSLYDLIQGIVFTLNKIKYPSGGLINLESFELFTPESGKWRALLDFNVSIPIDSNVDDNC